MSTLTGNMNYLQPSGFKVLINRKKYANLEFFAQSVSHPNLDLPAAEASFRGIQSAPMPGDTLTFGELSFSVIIDEDMKSYTEMYDWVRRIPSETVQEAGTDNPTASDITLSILSSKNNVIKKIRYLNAIPTGLGNIEFTSTIDSVTFLTYIASFRYTTFEIE